MCPNAAVFRYVLGNNLIINNKNNDRNAIEFFQNITRMDELESIITTRKANWSRARQRLTFANSMLSEGMEVKSVEGMIQQQKQMEVFSR